MKYATRILGLLLLGSAAPLLAQTPDLQVSIGQPEHGNIKISPSPNHNGTLPAGTLITVEASPDAGYQLDSVYHADPGIFGLMYLESMQSPLQFTLTEDTTVGALFLPQTEFAGYKLISDVVFAQPGVKPLKYDVWTPANVSTPLPLALIIHGGGWAANNEDIMRGMAREIVRTGRYVAVSIDYRWAGTGDGDVTGNSMTDIINDVFGAIAHIQEHAATYSADPAKIAVTGDSAGGHLAAVAITLSHRIGDRGFGLTPGIFEFLPSYLPEGKSVVRVRDEIVAAIQVGAPSYGVFSDNAYGGRAALQHYSGNPAADASWSAAIAPINDVPDISERAVPQYFVRGTVDPLIQDIMVSDFVQALQARGQHAVYDQVEGASHAFYDWKPDAQTRATFAQYGVPYIAEMVAFFDAIYYP